ncbi:MAG: PAS domain S-box protein [Pseudomonadota bacterium]
MQTVLQSVPDAMILIDEAGEMLAFSRSAEALFGYPAADVIGKNVSMLMAGADEAHHDRYISSYMSTGEKQIIGIGRVVRARVSSGKVIPVHLTIGEAKIGDRRFFAGYVRDVTDQQAADHQISRMQAELANFSRLSTAGTMASAMAHELNQPLTAVANYLEAARDMLQSPDAETLGIIRDALDSAASQSVRAGQIVRRLRDYVSRGEFETRKTDVADVVEQAISLSKLGGQHPLPRVISRMPESRPKVWCDALQIRQVILNLIRNAADATRDQTTAMIEVTGQRQDGTEFFEISVADNGPGLTLEEGRSPFEPFQSSKADGMGLGLSICQTIIEAHDGKIWVGESPFGGAKFSFTLKTVE